MKDKIKSPFLNSITSLASGSIIAQVITLISSPLMTRLYSSEEIGIYTLVITTISLFGGIICGRYEMSIVYEEDNNKINSLIKLSFLICLLFSIIISIAYLIYYKAIGNFSVVQVKLVIYIFILLLLTGINNILMSYNNRNKDYKLITSVNIIKALGKNVSLIIFGIAKMGSIGLVTSEIISLMSGMKIQFRSLKHSIRNIYNVNRKDMSYVFKKHYRQLAYSVPAIFANGFSYSSINFFVKGLYGSSVLGYYSISFRVLGLPLSIISNNVSKVFFEEASNEYVESKKYKKTFYKTSIFLGVLAIPMVLVMFFLAPYLFGWVFGKQWVIAGEYVKIMAPLFGMRFIVTALTPGLIICGRQKLELIIQLLFVVMSILCYLLAIYFKLEISQYLIIISISYSIVYFLYYILLLINSEIKTG